MSRAVTQGPPGSYRAAEHGSDSGASPKPTPCPARMLLGAASLAAVVPSSYQTGSSAGNGVVGAAADRSPSPKVNRARCSELSWVSGRGGEQRDLGMHCREAVLLAAGVPRSLVALGWQWDASLAGSLSPVGSD